MTFRARDAYANAPRMISENTKTMENKYETFKIMHTEFNVIRKNEFQFVHEIVKENG